MNIAITGANRGIGLELCRQYAARGEQVLAICRQRNDELGDIAKAVFPGLDISTASDREQLFTQLKQTLCGKPLDVLIHCAGVLVRQGLGDLDEADLLNQYRINAMAPLQLTDTLLPLLGDGSKIGIVSSRMGSIADNDSGSHYGYRMSKAAANAAGKSLAIDLQASGIAVAVLHPGYVRTRMTGFNGQIDPPEAAAGLLQRMDELTLGNSGQFWHANGEALPW
jgi:NAD(P)-dependent dehydrogenase (short-subunit alcohol dehydrogenase family)